MRRERRESVRELRRDWCEQLSRSLNLDWFAYRRTWALTLYPTAPNPVRRLTGQDYREILNSLTKRCFERVA